ncbi:MAG TPA: hypothetical protein VMV27_01975 [Candidatus Binataceae bacterium]|nr:hypothetical protein [Candidatus Binataceae bacterium]
MSAAEIRELAAKMIVVAILVSAVAVFAVAMGGCAQTHERGFIARCVVARAPLPGELEPGTGKALDIATNPIPFISPPHRLVEWCDSGAGFHLIDEQENSGASPMDYLSDPIDKAASMLTIPVL